MYPKPSRERLIAGLANIIGDYQRVASGQLEERIHRWISQFSEEVQEALLEELIHVFQKTYFSKKRIEEFFYRVLQTSPISGLSPPEFWRRVQYMDTQREGGSQKELLQLFSLALEQTYGYTVRDTEPTGDTFVYIDDGMFSGIRFRKDLTEWLERETLPEKVRIIVVSPAIHRKGYLEAKAKLEKEVAKKGVKLTFTRKFELVLESDPEGDIDLLWPTFNPSKVPWLAEYHATKSTASFKRRDKNVLGRNRLYSTPERRLLLEREFAMHGAKIALSFPKAEWNGIRPLGFNPDNASLGFGSMVVFYRNCPNTTPLVFWADYNWEPLFPRITNKARNRQEV